MSSSPTRFGVGADEQVIRPRLKALQWPNCLCKVLDERNPLHILQWRAREVLDKLHAAESGAAVGPTSLKNSQPRLLFNCFKVREQAEQLAYTQSQ